MANYELYICCPVCDYDDFEFCQVCANTGFTKSGLTTNQVDKLKAERDELRRALCFMAREVLAKRKADTEFFFCADTVDDIVDEYISKVVVNTLQETHAQTLEETC